MKSWRAKADPERTLGRPALRARLLVSAGLALALSACATSGAKNPASRAAIAVHSLPPTKTFAQSNPEPPYRSNRDIARDFLDLHFNLESGTALPIFTRFEGPITLRLTGAPGVSLKQDLTKLLSRLRTEAGVDIRAAQPGATAHITIESVSSRAIRQALPKAACFVVPNASSLSEYRRNRRSPATDWSQLRNRERLAIFIPNDVSPQEMRDCLHEELAQAIGPLNDLYRLPDSVFNDDNIHTVLTGFDMLVLRATFAPELRTGMTRSEVAQALPSILSRLNPRGDHIASNPLPPTPRSWIRAIETALGPGSSLGMRQQAAARALNIARSQNWHDHRLAQSHYVFGRLTQGADADLARQHFEVAHKILTGIPNSSAHRAVILPRLATYEIEKGNGQAALNLLAPALPVAVRQENAALLASLMLLQAEAMELTGQFQEARAVRVDSLGWARYGFGPEWAVEAKLNEVASLRPNHN